MKAAALLPMLAGALLPLTAHVAEQDGGGFDPEELRWKNRLLIVFAPAGSEELARRQENLWKDSAEGARERDMRLYVWRGADALPPVARNRYEIDPGDFAVLLIGKDGGVKLREPAPVEPDRIFAIIDSMPMRREEMRQR